MLPILQIGPFSLRTPGLALLAGLWLALEVASHEGERRGIDGDRIYSFGSYTLIAGVLGARLGFVALNLGLYTGITPWTRAVLSAITLAPGTENGWIGTLAAVIVAAVLIRRWRLPPLILADSFAPSTAVFTCGAALANLLSGDFYGVETDLPWGIFLWGAKRQPTQIYLLAAGFLILAILWRSGGLRSMIGRRELNTHDEARPPGFQAQITILLIGLAILLIEPLRADSPVIGSGIRLWEVIGLTGMIGGLAGFAARAPHTALASADAMSRTQGNAHGLDSKPD